MKSKMLFVLLFSYHLAFAQSVEENIVQEFNSGQTEKYYSNGEPKSKGLNIQFKYPKSFTSKEGDRPHVIRKFFLESEEIYSLIIINKMDKAATQTEITEAISINGLKSMLPSSANFISSNSNLKIEGLKAGSIEFTNNSARMDLNIFSYNQHYIIIYKSYLIYIQFSVIKKSEETKDELQYRYKTLKPLFYKMFNSLIIENIWNN